MALLSTLTDDFNTGSTIDTAKWTFTNNGTGGSASQSNGRLVLNAETTLAFNGDPEVYTTNTYDFTNDSAYVKLVTRSSHPSQTMCGFRIESSDPTDYIEIQVGDDGVIYVLACTDGSAVDGTTITYNATNHAWFRFRHGSGNLYFDTAPASASNPPASGDWTQQYSTSLAGLGWSGNITAARASLYFRIVANAAANPYCEWDGFNTASGTGVSGISATFAALENAVKDTFAAQAGTLQPRTATFAAVENVGQDIFWATTGTLGARQATFAAAENDIKDTFSAFASTAGTFTPPYWAPAIDADFKWWLRHQSSAKCLLVEVDVNDNGVEKTLYLSSVGYVTRPTDTPANQIYAADIIGGCTVEQEVALDYTLAMTLGDVEVSNIDGIRDHWFNYVWRNRSIRFYLGDVRWYRSDFRLVFSGTTQDLDSRDQGKLNIVLSDKMQRLNTSASSTLLGGSTNNSDKLIPLCFGECSNVTPLLVVPSTLTYQVHNGPIQDIVEVRDEGIPVAFTKFLADGKFVLAAQPTGRVTCTVQGDKHNGFWATRPADIIKRLVTGYGTQPLSNSELDLTNFANFGGTVKSGIYLENRENILDVCNLLASSISGALVTDNLNRLKLVKIEAFASGGVSSVISESNAVLKTFELVQRLDVQAAIKLGYCRNWTLQPDLQTGIPAEHKDLWADEWLTAISTDPAVADKYKLPLEPAEQINTYLIVASEAIFEADARLTLWSEQRTVWQYVGFGELLLDEIGDWQDVSHPRFGFKNGENALVLGIEKDWLNCKARIRIMK